MAVNIVGQAILQLSYLLMYLFKAQVRDEVFYTMIFNTFVMFQLINEVNCKSVSGGMQERFVANKDWKFWAVWLTTFFMQIIIVQQLGTIFSCTPLTIGQWIHCIIIGLIGVPWQMFVVDPVAGYLEGRISETEDYYNSDDEETEEEEEEEEDELNALEHQREDAPLLGKPRPRKNSLLSGISYNSIETKDAVSQGSSIASSVKDARAKRRWTLLKNALSFSSAISTNTEPHRMRRTESGGTLKRGHVMQSLIRSMSSRSLPPMSPRDDHM